MTLTPIGGQPTPRELVELAINNPLPNIDDLPPRSEFDITQPQLETELDDIAATQSDIRPVVRGQPSAVSVSESQTAMDAVAGSKTAMDAVAGSKTAMDAVVGSQVALDTVAGSVTAVGSIAEDPVGWSQIVLTPAVTSSFWTRAAVSEFWQYEGGVQVQSSANRFGGPALLLPSGTADVASWEIDAGSIGELNVTEKIKNGGRRNTNEFQILLGGTVVFSTQANNFKFNTRTIDISAFSGVVTLELQIKGGQTNLGDTLVSDITATE
jgi:hypothetical protein